jgi:hypothetical protein
MGTEGEQRLGNMRRYIDLFERCHQLSTERQEEFMAELEKLFDRVETSGTAEPATGRA